MTAPEPFTPPECDLRGLEYMPLLGQRLFGSEFNALASDSEWRAAMTLWWAAWTQCPAASLPDDDTALCRLADLGRDVKAWKKLRARALHGFVKCADGRLYHPTLAQQALVAWDKRVKERERKAKWRAEKDQKKPGQDADVPRDKTRTEQGPDATVPADETRRDGTGRDDIIEGRKEGGAGALDQPLPSDLIDLTAELCRTGGIRHVDPGPIMAAQTTVRQWLADGFDPATDLLPVIRQAVTDATERIGSLAYFDAAIRQTHARQEARRNGHTAQLSRGREPDLRGSRPDPALDLYRASCRAEEAARAAGGGEDRWRAWDAVSPFVEG